MQRSAWGAPYSHVTVTGRLAPDGKRAKTIKSARAMVDRLDREYGAASHTYEIHWIKE